MTDKVLNKIRIENNLKNKIQENFLSNHRENYKKFTKSTIFEGNVFK